MAPARLLYLVLRGSFLLSLRSQHDDRPTRGPGHLLSTVQRGGGMEVRPRVREHGEVQGGQIHFGAGVVVSGELNDGCGRQDNVMMWAEW